MIKLPYVFRDALTFPNLTSVALFTDNSQVCELRANMLCAARTLTSGLIETLCHAWRKRYAEDLSWRYGIELVELRWNSKSHNSGWQALW